MMVNFIVFGASWVFHIDFGHILGEGVSIDTGRFAITPQLKAAMGHQWADFVHVLVKGFSVVRKHAEVITEFIVMVMLPLATSTSLTGKAAFEARIRAFIRDTLMLDLDLGTAVLKLETEVHKSPNNFKTKLKNAVHAMATK